MDKLTTYAENTWCPGCGNFGIFSAAKKAVEMLETEKVDRNSIVMTTGIGCHGKIFDYLKLSGFYSLHGRSIATAQGMKLGNNLLNVIAFAGDGDAYGEGLSHLIFAAKRNADITVIIHNNGVYGLTTGQATPVSTKGFKGPSTPYGSIEDPINQFAIVAEAGATFIARGYSGKTAHLAELIKKAVLHRGFSFIEVLQPCVSFNNTYSLYNEAVRELNEAFKKREDVIEASRFKDKILIGVLYEEKKKTYGDSLNELYSV